jgi:hypothetical protein
LWNWSCMYMYICRNCITMHWNRNSQKGKLHIFFFKRKLKEKNYSINANFIKQNSILKGFDTCLKLLRR